MRFYGKALAAANAILRAFQTHSSLPAAIAPVFIQRKDGSPCRSWSCRIDRLRQRGLGGRAYWIGTVA
jgi:hypothetical protein